MAGFLTGGHTEPALEKHASASNLAGAFAAAAHTGAPHRAPENGSLHLRARGDVENAASAAGLDLEPGLRASITQIYREHLEEVRLNYTAKGLMNDDPEALSDASLQPTSAMAARIGDMLAGGGKNEKKSREFLHHMMIQELEFRLKELDRQIAALDRQIEEQEEKVDEIKKRLDRKYGTHWQTVLKKGDKDDPLYQQLIKDQEVQNYIREDNKLQKLRQERDELKREREEIKNQIEQARTRQEKLDNLGGEQKYSSKIEELKEERVEAYRAVYKVHLSQKEVEAALPEKGEEYRIDIETKQNLDVLFSSDRKDEGIDDEIERAMREIAKFRDIPDQEERLIAEYELVEGLSEEATEILSQEPEAKAMFEAGHFAALEGETESPQLSDVSPEKKQPETASSEPSEPKEDVPTQTADAISTQKNNAPSPG